MPKILGMKDGAIRGNDALQKRDKHWIRKRTFNQSFYVLSDDQDQTEDEIFLTTGIPPLWTVHRGAVCHQREAEEIQRVVHPTSGVPAILWGVNVLFDSDIDQNESQDDDPTAKTPTIRWFGETEEELMEKDAITDKPIETAAKEPILVTAPFVMPVLEIKRYETFPFDPNVILTYSHRTNSEIFWGAPKNSALFLPPEVDEEIVDGSKYAVATYRIKFKIQPGKDEPWKLRILHHGFKYRETAGEDPIVYTDEQGNPATVNLNDDGTILPATEDAKFLEFNRFKKIDFNTLSLGPF